MTTYSRPQQEELRAWVAFRRTIPTTIMGSTLNVCSWNSRGHAADRLSYLQTLLDGNDFVFVQEHWLFDDDLHRLCSNEDVNVIGVSGMDETDLLWDCSSHSTEIDTYYGRLIDAMKSAASECIPRQRKKALAGWSEVVTPYRNKSIFWNKVWVENGMPEVGLIRDIRQSSKKDYKHAAKWVIRNQDNITADRMATKLHSDVNREFWDEVKRVRGNAKDCAGVIDDAVGEDAICDVFASKYEELYSSVSFNADDMVELRRDVDIDIRSKCCEELCYSNHAVTVQDIKEALGKLKLSKSDADPDLSSDHFKRACPELYVHLSFLLTSMLRHTTAPSHVLCSIIRPIPKNRKKSLNEVLEKQSLVQRRTMGFELCIHLKTNFEKRITSCVCKSGVRINNGMSAE
ncbi:hypothetical protein CAPTEDRAFT_201883 [Capitella teleta]|uniref:Endonuclease/exonuclease/phosphatase domain-containing protein n=1 Tax=Capitella teleta TaxID=283909 RepID=R7VK34_CAPTE|nr:hypothetical protein CAPTEDRAFT_201883 [Capitella teleta]|eukprot:ELU17001.1 hypothetical protein CAPTEDRAFT_201883 [Capitella teleta]